MIIHLEKYLILPKKESVGGKASITTLTIPPTLDMAMQSAWIQVAAIAYMQAKGTQFMSFEEHYTLLEALFSSSQENSQSPIEESFFHTLRSKMEEGSSDFMNLLLASTGGHGKAATLANQFLEEVGADEVSSPVPFITPPIPPSHFKSGDEGTVEDAIFQNNPVEGLITKEIQEKKGLPDSINTIDNLNFGKIIVRGDIVKFPQTSSQAQDDSIIIPENIPVLIPVLSNDKGQGLSIIDILQPSNGMVAINDGNTLTYTPHQDFTGTDTFTYTIRDNQGIRSTAQVTIQVVATVRAQDDFSLTTENQAIIIPVKQNDRDPEGDGHVTVTTYPGHGTYAVNEDNTISYNPHPGFTGTDTFTYTLTDNGRSSTATVTVLVNPPSTLATDDSIIIRENIPVLIPVLSNDTGEGLHITGTGQSLYGTVAVNPDITLSYTPVRDYVGTDHFDYTVMDTHGISSTAQVTIKVTENQNTLAIMANSMMSYNNEEVQSNQSDSDLTGGEKADLFVFSVKDCGRDEIRIFTVGQDHIQLKDVVDIQHDIINVHDDGRNVTLDFHEGGSVVINNIGGHNYNTVHALIDNGIVVQPVTP